MSTPEHPEALGLEQKCLRPGHWMIEGHNVVRFGYKTWDKGSVDWCIFDLGATGVCAGGARPIHMTKTLAAARDWIRLNG